MKEQRGGRDISLPIQNLSSRRAQGGQRYVTATLPTGGKSGTQEAGWALGPVWVHAEKLTNIRIRTPDRLSRSEPLVE
jgi:hypothetical protein